MPTPPLLIRALRREPVPRTPVWIMRQAGRYLPEYRAVREKVDFLTLCHDAELAAQVTLDAARILDVDAAILFSDILVPAEAMGAEVDFLEGGPRIGNPVRSRGDVARLAIPDPAADLSFVAAALRAIRADLPPDKALIGFAAAPFTLAAYLVEGQPTRDFMHARGLLRSDPGLAHALLERIAAATVVCLEAQVAAGAEVVQLFDSWAGFLAPVDYQEFAQRHAAAVLDALRGLGVPTILYVNGGAGVLERTARAGADCVGVDWRVDLGEAWARIGYDRALQGNLDPAALFAPPAAIEESVKQVLAAAGGRPGHVFNLGHGIHKDTPVQSALSLVAAVKRHGAVEGDSGRVR